MSRKRALTVAFTGIDGSGKSTLAAHTAAWLGEHGRTAHLIKIRSGRSGLERFADKRNHGDLGAFAGWDTALMMMGAIAWQSIRDTKPLRRDPGAVLLLDRCHHCVLALAKMHAPAAEPKLRDLFASVPGPDIVIHVTVNPAIAAARLAGRGGTPKTAEFLDAFEAAYRSLTEFASFRVIDGNATPEAMAGQTQSILAPLLTH